MTKQDKIRAGLRTELTFSVEDTEYWEIGNHFALRERAISKLLNYLHDNGVVIKVKRKLPKNPCECCKHEDAKADDDYCFMVADCGDNFDKWKLDTGYTAWEPLIGD